MTHRDFFSLTPDEIRAMILQKSPPLKTILTDVIGLNEMGLLNNSLLTTTVCMAFVAGRLYEQEHFMLTPGGSLGEGL